jgi:hypothetical protein
MIAPRYRVESGNNKVWEARAKQLVDWLGDRKMTSADLVKEAAQEFHITPDIIRNTLAWAEKSLLIEKNGVWKQLDNRLVSVKKLLSTANSSISEKSEEVA